MDNLRVIGGRLSAKMEFCYSDGFPLNGLGMNGMQSIFLTFLCESKDVFSYNDLLVS